MIEVEAKYRIDDVDDVRRRLGVLGATGGEDVHQADEYFAHPQRDFAESNESFRLRSIGDENRLTYKGPLLDTSTKSRREIEVPVAAGPAMRESMRQLLTALGFRGVRVVEKRRQTYQLRSDDLEFEICLDHVKGLGDFIELETAADEDAWQSARDALLCLAAELNLTGSERRSYLELLLAAGST